MKITSEQQEKGKEVYHKLVQKAWESATFKEELINNPKVVIENLLGKKGNFTGRLIVEDQTDPSKIYLNIPRKASIQDLELTEEQMELIAGGGFFQDLGIAFGHWLTTPHPTLYGGGII